MKSAVFPQGRVEHSEEVSDLVGEISVVAGNVPPLMLDVVMLFPPFRLDTSFFTHDPSIYILPHAWDSVPRCLPSATPLIDKEVGWIGMIPRSFLNLTADPFKGSGRTFSLSRHQVGYVGLHLTYQSGSPHKTYLQEGILRKVSGILQSGTRRLSSMLR